MCKVLCILQILVECASLVFGVGRPHVGFPVLVPLRCVYCAFLQLLVN